MPTPTTARDVRLVLADVVAGYDAAVVSGPAAARDVAEFARIEKLAAAGRMLAAARVEETQAWIGSGHRSPQDWLAGEAGTSVADAAGVLEAAEQLKALPATASAVRAGDLSSGQARAVAGAASVDPSAETELLATARRETSKGLRDAADRVKAAATDDATRHKRIRARRSLRRRVDADGAHHLVLYGPATDGVRLAEALKPIEEQVFRDARTAARAGGERPSYEARSYDAFMQWVGLTDPPTGTGATGGDHGEPVPGGPESTLFPPNPDHVTRPTPSAPPTHTDTVDPEPVTGSETATCTCGSGADRSAASTHGPGRVPRGANTKIIVLIDHSALCRGHAVAGETVEVAGLGPVPVTTVHELMGDAFLAAAVLKGRDVVNVAHLGRTVNAHQRTALEAMRLQCSNIACNATIGTEIDHRTPWATNAETRLDNQDPLCRTDHDRKTHHGWALEPGTGRRRFLPPDHPGRREPARTGPARAGPTATGPTQTGPP